MRNLNAKKRQRHKDMQMWQSTFGLQNKRNQTSKSPDQVH